MEPTVNRYSDAELEEFRQIIVDKLEKARTELEDLRKQVLEITENAEGDFGSDWMDDSSIANDLELLNEMAIRQRKYIQDLENALVRIKNKTYGICVITGQLIDKKRLMAVPTTTKSIAAKLDDKPKTAIPTEDLPHPRREPSAESPGPKIITKIIRKPTSAPEKSSGGNSKKDVDDFLDDMNEEENFWEDLNLSDIDPDTISDDSDQDSSSYDNYEEEDDGGGDDDED